MSRRHWGKFCEENTERNLVIGSFFFINKHKSLHNCFIVMVQYIQRCELKTIFTFMEKIAQKGKEEARERLQE
jgi:hypothetical protein